MVSFVAQLKNVIRPMFQNSSFVQHCVHSACWCDGVGYGILQSILGSGWRIDASWLNANERWCCVCQGGLGCNLSAEPARSPNDIIRKCRQQRSNEEWSDARCFTSLLRPPRPFFSVVVEHLGWVCLHIQAIKSKTENVYSRFETLKPWRVYIKPYTLEYDNMEEYKGWQQSSHNSSQ